MEIPLRKAPRHASSPKAANPSLHVPGGPDLWLTATGLRLLALMICFLLLAVHVSSPTAASAPSEPGASENSQAPQGENPNAALELGKPVARELSGGESHSYKIVLVAGQYLHVVVEQRGIDVVVALYSPDGTKLTEMDSPNGADGPEWIFWIAQTTGGHRLEVRSLEKDAKAGKYEAKVETLRQSAPEDIHRLRAERGAFEAWVLTAEGTAESLRKAIVKLTDAVSEWRAAGEPARVARGLLMIAQNHSFLGNKQKALEYYSQALLTLRQVGDRSSEATTLNNLGGVYDALGEKQKALDYYNQALLLRREVGDRRGEATTLNNIGLVHFSLGDKQKPLEYFNQALAIQRQVGDRHGEAITLNSIGRVYDTLGDKQKALEHYSQALAIQRQVGDRRGEATSLNNIGGIYHGHGDKQKPLEYFNQALAIQRQVGDRRSEAITLNNIGSVYSSLGDKQKALDYFNQALPLRRQVGDRNGEATTLNNIGRVYDTLGDEQKALEYYSKALPLRRQVGDRGGEAMILNNLGGVYDTLGQPQKALDYYNQALLLRREVGDRRGEATTLINIGGAYNALGDTQKALEYFNQALPIQQQVGNRGGEAIALINIGSIYSDRGEKQKALDYSNQALKITHRLGDLSVEAASLKLAAKVERDLGRLAEARSHIEAALALIESIRSRVVGHELRSSFVDTVQPFYWLCVDILMRMHKEQPTGGFEAAALQASERGRARSLLDMLVESHADIYNGVDAGLLARERSLQQLLAGKRQRHVELASRQETEDESNRLAKEIDLLTGQYQEVEAEIRARSPKYAALTQPQPLDLKQIQQRVLDKDTLLLEFSIGEERSYLWIAGVSSITSYELPRKAEIELLAKHFSKLASGGGQEEPGRAIPVTEDPDYREYALRLSRMLLGPAAVLLGEKRLLIVADGALEYIPFAALPDPAARENEDPENPLVPLLVRHEIVSAPSASVIDGLRNELKGRKPAAKTAAVLADPVFSANDPRVANAVKAEKPPSNPGAVTPSLQRLLAERAAKDASDLGLLRGDREFIRLCGTRKEADAIESLLARGQCKKAVDFEASKEMAEDPELGQYRYVHFGTHGLINPKHPALTGLLLSMVDSKGKPVDGFLAASEVYNLKLPAEMVVLSACRTALGTEVRGEGLVGLTRGFMYAGAARVVASLWKVYDAATAELMTRFYRGVLKEGKPPAAALRAAQLEMWRQKQYRAPYYWAAFELQGEWR